MNTNYYYLQLDTHYLTVPYSQKDRRIRVLLPKDYQESEKHYPVIYMHDGQNVFHSKEAFSGHSWKVIPTLKRNPDLPPMIIVGIDNDGMGRMDEYTPWHIVNNPNLQEETLMGGFGNEYGDFVMEVVKPFIDENYRTKPEKKFTAMAGSSLGGNISAFLGIKYQDQIGGLGIFSIANWITQLQFDRYLARHPLNEDQRVYIQVGTKEGDSTDRQLMSGNMRQNYIDSTISYYQGLLKAGLPIDQIDLNIIEGDTHTEAVWAKHFPSCLRFLSENW